MIIDDLIFQTIVARYKKSVYRIALRMLDDEDDAEEVTQDVFLKTYQGIQNLHIEEGLWNWIYRVTVNTCISHRRGSEPEPESIEEIDTDIADEEQDPEQTYLKAELQELLPRWLARIPVGEAAAITLLYYEKKSYEEIASIMQLPPGTVATFIHRGRNRLHTLFIKEFQETPR